MAPRAASQDPRRYMWQQALRSRGAGRHHRHLRQEQQRRSQSRQGPKPKAPLPAAQLPWRLLRAALLQQWSRWRKWLPVIEPTSLPVQCPVVTQRHMGPSPRPTQRRQPEQWRRSGQLCLWWNRPLHSPTPLPLHIRRGKPLQAGIALHIRSVELDGTTWCGTMTSRRRRTRRMASNGR